MPDESCHSKLNIDSKMVKRKSSKVPSLINQTRIRVRFSEVDSMQIVWHGEYVRYFEDGREAFGGNTVDWAIWRCTIAVLWFLW